MTEFMKISTILNSLALRGVQAVFSDVNFFPGGNRTMFLNRTKNFVNVKIQAINRIIEHGSKKLMELLQTFQKGKGISQSTWKNILQLFGGAIIEVEKNTYEFSYNCTEILHEIVNNLDEKIEIVLNDLNEEDQKRVSFFLGLIIRLCEEMLERIQSKSGRLPVAI